jgi:small subunit ribosomal protein S4
MGDPRRLRSKYRTPINPFERARIAEDMKYLGRYGLRNKKEYLKHRSQISNFRNLARQARAYPEKAQLQALSDMRSRLSKIGLISKEASFDDILSITVEQLLDRRLQTMVYKKGLARTIQQARQFVVHGHISLKGKLVDTPSYIVKKDEEDTIAFAINSPFLNQTTKIWGEETPKTVADVSTKETEEIKKEQKGKEKPHRGGGRRREGRPDRSSDNQKGE